MDSTSTTEWELHQKYGIIHAWFCVACKNYISHLESFYAQPNVSATSLYEIYYRDGVRDGMKVAKFHADNSLKELGVVKLEKEAALDRLAVAHRKCLELEGRLAEMPSQSEQDKTLRQKTRPLAAASAPDSGQSSSGGRHPSIIYSPQSTTPVPPCRSIKLATQFPIQVARDPTSRPPSLLSMPPSTRDVSQTALPPTSHRFDGPKTNPRLEDPVEVWYDYYCTHQKSWPRGVRCDSRHRPILSDLRADRAIARFRPDVIYQRGESFSSGITLGTSLFDAQEPFPSPSPRNQFKNLIVEIFSQQGLYGERVKELGLGIASKVTYHPYTGPFPIVLGDVVYHLAQSGITREMAEDDFEAWARNYKAGVNCSIPFTPGSSQQNRRRR